MITRKRFYERERTESLRCARSIEAPARGVTPDEGLNPFPIRLPNLVCVAYFGRRKTFLLCRGVDPALDRAALHGFPCNTGRNACIFTHAHPPPETINPCSQSAGNNFTFHEQILKHCPFSLRKNRSPRTFFPDTPKNPSKPHFLHSNHRQPPK